MTIDPRAPALIGVAQLTCRREQRHGPEPLAVWEERRIAEDHVGTATRATYTVMYDRDGEASHGAAICDLPSGDSAYARIRNRELLASAESEELVGRAAEIGARDKVGEVVRLV